MSTLLHHKIEGDGLPLVLLHGLFGNLDNLGALARDLKKDYQVIRVDLRNHGLSFSSKVHHYDAMAQDIAELLKALKCPHATLIGHSMGGKVAMKVAMNDPALVRSLIVMDMAPVKYDQHRHDNVFAGLFAVLEQKPTSREQAMQILAEHVNMASVRQFLGKSLFKNGAVMTWRFGVHHLYNNYERILDWQSGSAVSIPTLFLKGANSDYITPESQSSILSQFPMAKAHIIANTGHWLHAEKPHDVLRIIRKFLSAQSSLFPADSLD
jgi:esterase